MQDFGATFCLSLPVYDVVIRLLCFHCQKYLMLSTFSFSYSLNQGWGGGPMSDVTDVALPSPMHLCAWALKEAGPVRQAGTLFIPRIQEVWSSAAEWG